MTKENPMGLFDKVKNKVGKTKDQIDDLVDQHGDKIPDDIEKQYDKASDLAAKIVPGDDAPGK